MKMDEILANVGGVGMERETEIKLFSIIYAKVANLHFPFDGLVSS